MTAAYCWGQHSVNYAVDSIHTYATELYDQGKYEAAIREYDLALNGLLESDSIDYNKLAHVQFEKAYALYYLQQRTEELQASLKAIEYMRLSQNPEEEFIIDLYVDIAFSSIGDGHFDQAADYLQSAKSTYDKLVESFPNQNTTKHHSSLLNIYYNYTYLYSNARDEKAMLQSIKIMEEKFKQIASPSSQNSEHLAAAYNCASEFYQKKEGAFQITHAYIEKAIGIADKNNLEQQKRAYIFNMSKLLLNNGRLVDAEAHAKQLIAEAEEKEDSRLSFFYILGLKIARASNDKKRAQVYLKKAIALYCKEGAICDIPLEKITYEIIEPTQSIYESRLWAEQASYYIDSFAESGDSRDLNIGYHFAQIAANNFKKAKRWDEYSAYIEESSQAIMNELLQSIILKANGKVNDADLQMIHYTREDLLWKRFLRKRNSTNNYSTELTDSLTILNNQILSSLNSSDTDQATERKLADLKTKRTSISKDLSYSYSKAFDDETVTNLDSQLESVSTPDKKVLRYFVEMGDIFLLEMNNQRSNLRYIGKLDSIKSDLTSIYQDLKKPYSSLKKIQQRAATLYAFLLGQIDLSDISSLIVIRDDLLHYLPFEVLRNNEQYLVEQLNISYTSSLQLYKQQVALPRKSQLRTAIYYKTYEDLENIYASARGGTLSLKGTKQEASAISSIMKTSVYEDQELSKSLFLKTFPEFDIIHVAAHAVVDDSNSDLSHVVFDRGDEMSNLFVGEMKGLTMLQELVVLSACETGIGGIANGNGLRDMSRAITLAGARSNIVSLWQVPDKESAALMTSFYQSLKDGKDKAASLRSAKLYMINRDGGEAHPYYWAAWILSGDESPLFDDRPPMRYLSMLAITLCLVIFLFIRMRPG